MVKKLESRLAVQKKKERTGQKERRTELSRRGNLEWDNGGKHENALQAAGELKLPVAAAFST